MVVSTPRILTWLNTSKPDSTGKFPIWIRITYRGRRAELSTGIFIEKQKYKGGDDPIRGTRAETDQKNLLISNIKLGILSSYNALLAKGGEISARRIKETYQGIDSTSHGLIEAFDSHNSRIKDLIAKGEFSTETLELFEIQKEQIKEFTNYYCGNDDIPLKAVDYRYLNELEFWFKKSKDNKHNTVRKKFQRLGKILTFSMKLGWIDTSPMSNYVIKEKEKEIVFLSDKEISKLKKADLNRESLKTTRDRFLFSCYTGLAYKELSELNWEQVAKSIDGTCILILRRYKTEKEFTVPLLKAALEILNKYKRHPVAIADGTCFPKISNQQYNSQLKELATAAKIGKQISTHTARKTFATWALTHGVPMETVSQVLGHSNLRITQKSYGKIVNEKVSRDMSNLDKRLAKNGESQ